MQPLNKYLVVSLTVLLGIAIALLAPPVAQDPGYHNFADREALFGIPNFRNAISSLPFMLFGALGLYTCSNTQPAEYAKSLQWPYTLFFTASILVGMGSGYYHLYPDSNTLVFDRLAMTIVFMSFFSVVIVEYLSAAAGRALLPILLFAGMASILYWHKTELAGSGDLRFYAVIQFLPIVVTIVILLLFRRPGTTDIYLWAILFVYLLAKLAEHFDAVIFNISFIISGHTLKHLLSSFGIIFFLLHFNSKHKQQHGKTS